MFAHEILALPNKTVVSEHDPTKESYQEHSETFSSSIFKKVSVAKTLTVRIKKINKTSIFLIIIT